MKLLTAIILTTSLTACAVGKREVKYTEMSAPPKLTIDNEGLVIRTQNSKENSALLIYKIQPKIDHPNKLILLHGFQAFGKDYQTSFHIKLDKTILTDLSSYKINWVDPDNKKTELRIETH